MPPEMQAAQSFLLQPFSAQSTPRGEHRARGCHPQQRRHQCQAPTRGPAQASKCWGQRRRKGGSLLGHPSHSALTLGDQPGRRKDSTLLLVDRKSVV